MRILLHTCCAVCALHPLDRLRRRGERVVSLWYNPNIHPVREYRARLGALRDLQGRWKFDLIVRDEYGLVDFVRAVAGREEARCEHCYRIRLEEAARTARAEGLDAFSTTLLISPYQRIDRIREIGAELAAAYDVEFLGEDFRPGFRKAQQTAAEMGLYRQGYCGCIYSEMDRYLKRRKPPRGEGEESGGRRSPG